MYRDRSSPPIPFIPPSYFATLLLTQLSRLIHIVLLTVQSYQHFLAPKTLLFPTTHWSPQRWSTAVVQHPGRLCRSIAKREEDTPEPPQQTNSPCNPMPSTPQEPSSQGRSPQSVGLIAGRPWDSPKIQEDPPSGTVSECGKNIPKAYSGLTHGDHHSPSPARRPW